MLRACTRDFQSGYQVRAEFADTTKWSHGRGGDLGSALSADETRDLLARVGLLSNREFAECLVRRWSTRTKEQPVRDEAARSERGDLTNK